MRGTPSCCDGNDVDSPTATSMYITGRHNNQVPPRHSVIRMPTGEGDEDGEAEEAGSKNECHGKKPDAAHR